VLLQEKTTGFCWCSGCQKSRFRLLQQIQIHKEACRTAIIHRKKRFTSFPSPAGMSLTKLPLGRNNSVMTSLFPPRESLVVTSLLGTGNSRTFFYGVIFSGQRSLTGTFAAKIHVRGCTDVQVSQFRDNWRGGGHTRWWRGGWGFNILEDARHSSVLYTYVSTLWGQRGLKGNQRSSQCTNISFG
jgi:hypothetical protein